MTYWEPAREIERLTVQICELRAEVERLKAENADLRRWKAMDKPLTAAMKVVSNDVQKLRAQLNEAAAFLDGLANRLAPVGPPLGQETADCRAMAAKLRGET